LTSGEIVDPFGDDFNGTTDAWRNSDCVYRTIQRTGSTLHTGVEIKNYCLFFDYIKDAVGAYLLAATTAYAGLFIESESRCIFDISEILQLSPSYLSNKWGNHPEHQARKYCECLNRYAPTHFILDTGWGGIGRAACEVHSLKRTE
jgi:hypothetical protein